VTGSGCGCGVGAVVDRDSIQRRGRSERGAQRLRDISHLYLSGSRRGNPSPPAAKRRLRLGFVTVSDTLAKVDVCANLAVQYARMGRRTLVLDLDPSLPNVGFRMGLAPELYLRHLRQSSQAALGRSALGVRLLGGIATAAVPDLPPHIQQELENAECVLVNLAAQQSRLRWLQALQAGTDALESTESAPMAPVPRRPAAATTTMRRAGAQSRMFGAWLATSRGAPKPAVAPSAAPATVLDALLFVQQDDADDATELAMQMWRRALGPIPVHLVRCVSRATEKTSQSRLSQWVTLQAQPSALSCRQPSSLLYPEHPTSRVFENLAQSLLASLAASGGVRVRAS